MGVLVGPLSAVNWKSKKDVIKAAQVLADEEVPMYVSTGPRGYVIGFVERLNEPGYLRGKVVWRSDT